MSSYPKRIILLQMLQAELKDPLCHLTKRCIRPMAENIKRNNIRILQIIYILMQLFAWPWSSSLDP